MHNKLNQILNISNTSSCMVCRILILIPHSNITYTSWLYMCEWVCMFIFDLLFFLLLFICNFKNIILIFEAFALSYTICIRLLLFWLVFFSSFFLCKSINNANRHLPRQITNEYVHIVYVMEIATNLRHYLRDEWKITNLHLCINQFNKTEFSIIGR